jgi:hypothetical protein
LEDDPFLATHPVECVGAVPELVKIAGQIVALQLFLTVIVRSAAARVTRERGSSEDSSIF